MLQIEFEPSNSIDRGKSQHDAKSWTLRVKHDSHIEDLIFGPGVTMPLTSRVVGLLVLLMAWLISPALAENQPIAFEADQVTVNQETGSMYAVGNVILRRADTELFADEVTYDKELDKAVARGNVLVVGRDGSQRRSDVMTLDTEFTHIVADNLRTKFADGSFMLADQSDTVTGDKSVFTSSRFSPCKCDVENGESPMWDVRATSSIHNEKTQTITHRNVRMHVLNLPVFYMPYLAHPDWTVRRRTGFLTPSMSISSDRGFTPAVPFFYIIDDTSDARFTAYKYQYRGAALETLYRKRWDNAEFDATLFTAKVNTYKKDRENVAAIQGRFHTNIGDGWDVTADFARSSQDTFLRRYQFNQSTKLKSSIVAERIKPDRYYLVEASDLQGLAASDTADREPTILPRIIYEKVRLGWRPNQTFLTEISAIQLDNDEQHDLARWSGAFEVSEEFRRNALITGYRANVTGSYYAIHTKPDSATTDTGEIGQINPSMSLGARLPVAISGWGRSAILEPKAQLVWVGGADRTQEVPNRDAGDYRIDEANLFLLNRYQGKDYVLPGTRADMGVSAIANDRLFGEVAGFIGVSRRLAGKPSAGLAPNQDDTYSDYVASLSIDPPQPLSINWSGRLSSHDFTLNESKTSIATKLGKMSLTFSHNQLAQAYFANSASDREELVIAAGLPLKGGWNASASQNWDLSNGRNERKNTNATLLWNGGAQDCLTLRFDYTHDATNDRDVSGVDEIKFTFSFKYLGAISKDDVTSYTGSDS